MAGEKIYFIGVDVGSGSARAALVDKAGHVLTSSVKELQTWKPAVDFYEQSSNDIWECCVCVIKNITANVDPASIKGIGFDATCSLVALDKNGIPAAVNKTGNDEQNIIMWMDHRAHAEADLINKTDHDILKYVGGKVSLEMEMPKLLWLKTHLPNRWSEYGYFFDLPDFLTWKATGSLSRSLCSLVCKWNYECSSYCNMGWNTSFLREIGLGDLAENNFKKIGNKVLMPGEACGGLSQGVAEVLGLKPGTPVATSIIDAHAGGLGMIGTNGQDISRDMSSRLSLICGTSTCHMAVNKDPVLVEGVWGPYFSAMVPQMWLNEAGQSASGMLMDHVISSHPAGIELLKTASTGEVRGHLRQLLSKMAAKKGLSDVSKLTNDFHVWPDFHGNRSPLADPTMKGMVVGLTIDNSVENLALLYLATLQALSVPCQLRGYNVHGVQGLGTAALERMRAMWREGERARRVGVVSDQPPATPPAPASSPTPSPNPVDVYGTRHIIDELVTSGYQPFKSLLICGGLSKDPLFVQIQSDAVGIPMLKPYETDSVLVGSAILGACASQYFNSLQDTINSMGGTAEVIRPNASIKQYHDKKYRVFLQMFQDQREYRRMMH